MLTALKWSGTSVTVGSLVAAITVRVIAGGAEVVCAAPEAGSAIAPSNNSPVVLNCMIASQVQRIIGAPYALPTPLGMAGRFELLLDGNREQRSSETEFVVVGVNWMKEALSNRLSSNTGRLSAVPPKNVRWWCRFWRSFFVSLTQFPLPRSICQNRR